MPAWPFNPASPQTQAISNLFAVVMIIAAVIFVIVTGLVLYIVIRYRHRPGQGDPQQDFGRPRLEIVWTAIPTLILIVVLGFTVNTMQAADPSVGQQQPDLIVTGHQWWWEIRYPKSSVITANEIHVPVGTRLIVELDSADVIHNFWVPALAPKRDAVPGAPNYIWLEADQPGVYLGVCGEYCGTEHAWMRLRVIAQPQAEFDAWQQQQLAIPVAPATGDAAQGAQLFQQLTCGSCHAIVGTAAQARIGPDLTHVSTRQTLGAGVLDNSPNALELWLSDPQAIKPGILMPNFHLTDAQVRVLTAYLESLK